MASLCLISISQRSSSDCDINSPRIIIISSGDTKVAITQQLPDRSGTFILEIKIVEAINEHNPDYINPSSLHTIGITQKN